MIQKMLVVLGLAGWLLSACGGGASSGTPVNCNLNGGAPCPSTQVCAVIDEGDAGSTRPICMLPTACGSLSCASGKCAESVETSPSTKSCIK
jgi:hypothetical protein